MIDLVLHLTARGLPEPVREYPFTAELKRKHRFDFAYPDRKIGIEIDGGVYMRNIDGSLGGRHNRGEGFLRDLEKFNLAALLHWRVVRFTPKQVHSGYAADFIQQLLEAS